jgi:hypothetical protein
MPKPEISTGPVHPSTYTPGLPGKEFEMTDSAHNEDIIDGELALAPIEESRQVSAPLATGTTPTPADLLAMAMTQGANLDQMERLMAMNERWEANQAKKAFDVAMAGFKSEAVEILKRKRVHFQTAKGSTSYNHAELSDVTDAAIPAMAKHGLSNSWDINQTDGGWIEVTCEITHCQGHTGKKVTMRSQKEDSGTKNQIQQVASAITYLQRYTLLAALGLSTKGMDDDGRGASKPRASANEPVAADNPEREKIVMDLYACADNGMAELIKAWKALPERSRVMVGTEFGQIKKHAEKAGA